MPRVVSWFSCGVASAVATKMAQPTTIAYCDTGAEHPDNERFLAECETWFGHPVTRLKSDKYKDTWDVWEKERYLSGVDGAKCTGVLKMALRLAFQRLDDVHVFGYTADGPDQARARRLRENYPELQIRTPLIDAGVTKAGCMAIVEKAGIELPIMYRLGFSCNNCIPCVKASAPGYWALVRREFPQHFERMVCLSRGLGVKLTRLEGERAYIDEIPADYPVSDPIQPNCDFLCQLATL